MNIKVKKLSPNAITPTKAHLSDGSHQIVSATCELNISENCKGTYELVHKDMILTRKRNNDKFMCMQCSRKLKSSGNDNPNTKYKFDRDLFSEIDSEEKAYILGFIASDGHLSKRGGLTVISIHKKDIDILYKMRDFICKDIPIAKKRNTIVTLAISSRKINSDICRHLMISSGKKSNCVNFPNLPKDLDRHFLRGYFDGDGCVHRSKSSPKASIYSNSSSMLKSIKEKFGGNLYKTSIEWNSNNCLDFLSKIYDNSKITMNRKYDRYLKISSWIPSLTGSGNYGKLPELRWNRCKKDAVTPSKNLPSDSGYDLTIIDIVKDCGDVKFYGTGIKITPEFGWYFEVVPRSSISKTGYILTNSVGIIDRSYVGEILIALRKVDKNSPDIELPLKIAQLIPRPILNFELIEVDSLEESERGDGGFGSSDKKSV